LRDRSNFECGRYDALTLEIADSDEYALLFDQPVGALLERQGYVETECIGGFEIDVQFVFDRGLNGKLSRLLALEDAIGVAGRATKIVDLVVSVGQKSSPAIPGQCDRHLLRLYDEGQPSIWISYAVPSTFAGSQEIPLILDRQ